MFFPQYLLTFPKPRNCFKHVVRSISKCPRGPLVATALPSAKSGFNIDAENAVLFIGSAPGLGYCSRRNDMNAASSPTRTRRWQEAVANAEAKDFTHCPSKTQLCVCRRRRQSLFQQAKKSSETSSTVRPTKEAWLSAQTVQTPLAFEDGLHLAALAFRCIWCFLVQSQQRALPPFSHLALASLVVYGFAVTLIGFDTLLDKETFAVGTLTSAVRYCRTSRRSNLNRLLISAAAAVFWAVAMKTVASCLPACSVEGLGGEHRPHRQASRRRHRLCHARRTVNDSHWNPGGPLRYRSVRTDPPLLREAFALGRSSQPADGCAAVLQTLEML